MCEDSRCWKWPPPFWIEVFTHFTASFATFVSLLVSAGNSHFSVMFEVLQFSWVIDIDSFFTKSTQNWVRWCRALWTRCQRPILTTQSPKNSCKKLLCPQYGGRPVCFETCNTVPFLPAQLWIETPTFDDYRGFSCTACGVSALFYLLTYPLKLNGALQKAKCPTHETLRVTKSCNIYGITA